MNWVAAEPLNSPAIPGEIINLRPLEVKRKIRLNYGKHGSWRYRRGTDSVPMWYQLGTTLVPTRIAKRYKTKNKGDIRAEDQLSLERMAELSIPPVLAGNGQEGGVTAIASTSGPYNGS